MKKLSKNLSKRLLTVLNKDPNFKDAYQMVCNRSKTKPYLVGGKLYRTLIELMYDYPARSHSCDFDFAVCEVVKRKRFKEKTISLHDGTFDYIQVPVNGTYGNGGSTKMRTREGASIDLIDISGLKAVRAKKQPLSIEGYIGSVPLSVQAIAMDIEKCEVFGKVGLDSLNEKYVWVHNSFTMEQYIKYKGGTVDRYIKKKADSIRFGCPVKPKPKNKIIRGYPLSPPSVLNDFIGPGWLAPPPPAGVAPPTPSVVTWGTTTSLATE